MGQSRARAAVAAGIAILIGSEAMGSDRPNGELYSTRSVVMAQRGMAATSQPLATQVAVQILCESFDALAMVQTVSLPCVFVHLQNDNRHPYMATLTVVEYELPTRAGWKDLVNVDLDRSTSSRRGRSWRR